MDPIQEWGCHSSNRYSDRLPEGILVVRFCFAPFTSKGDMLVFLGCIFLNPKNPSNVMGCQNHLGFGGFCVSIGGVRIFRVF